MIMIEGGSLVMMIMIEGVFSDVDYDWGGYLVMIMIEGGYLVMMIMIEGVFSDDYDWGGVFSDDYDWGEVFSDVEDDFGQNQLLMYSDFGMNPIGALKCKRILIIKHMCIYHNCNVISYLLFVNV